MLARCFTDLVEWLVLNVIEARGSRTLFCRI